MPTFFDEPWFREAVASDAAEDDDNETDKEDEFDDKTLPGPPLPRRCRGFLAAELTRQELVDDVLDRYFFDLFRMRKDRFF